jgi:hypothetical protein
VVRLSKDEGLTALGAARNVVPAKAGIHFAAAQRFKLDPGFRRDDEAWAVVIRNP